MSTIKTPVHILVDEMSVIAGPSADALNRLYDNAPEAMGDYTDRAFKMTLTTAASSREFKRKVTIRELEPEREGLFSETEAGLQFNENSGKTGRFIIKGFIGDWCFTGTYDPKTRKGTLMEDEYDPEDDDRQEDIDGMSEYMYMQTTY